MLLQSRRQSRKRFFNAINERFRQLKRCQIGFGEITVIVGFFLVTHRKSGVGVCIKTAGLLNDFFAFFRHDNHAVNFVLNRLFHVPNGIQILYFHFGSKLRFAPQPDGHICIAAQASFLHVAIAHTYPSYQFPHFGHVLKSLLCRVHVGFCHYFYKRHSGTVIVNARVVFIGIVNAFSGIFFQMNAVQLHIFQSVFCLDGHMSAFANGCGVLRHLIALWKVGIEIIFTGKIVVLLYFAMAGQPHTNGIFHRFFINTWQRTGMPQSNGADVRIGFCTKCGTIARKQFAFRLQLRMYLQPNHHFVFSGIVHFL